jgi:GNAT superfamily N-acetyltransferase
VAPRYVTLRDGARVLIRPITPDDREALRAGFERLSDESRYRRFMSPIPRLTDGQLDYLTRIDHHDHEALAAVDSTGDGGIVGVARFVRSGEAEAEPAIVVADDWQGKGLGTALLEALRSGHSRRGSSATGRWSWRRTRRLCGSWGASARCGGTRRARNSRWRFSSA